MERNLTGVNIINQLMGFAGVLPILLKNLVELNLMAVTLVRENEKTRKTRKPREKIVVKVKKLASQV